MKWTLFLANRPPRSRLSRLSTVRHLSPHIHLLFSMSYILARGFHSSVFGDPRVAVGDGYRTSKLVGAKLVRAGSVDGQPQLCAVPRPALSTWRTVQPNTMGSE